jgi:hypothetical protein
VSATITIDHAPAAGHPTTEFLDLLPIVERQVRFAFRGRPAVDREEAAAEAVAAAYASYVGLKARGKDPVRDFPSALAAYAVLHVKAGRMMGSGNSTTDALSPLAQRKRGFRVEPLPKSFGVARDRLQSTNDRRRQDEFEDQLRDNTRSAVPDQAAFRIDFPEFLACLGSRDRTLARFLALGNSAQLAADQFGLSEGRVSQLRKRWREWWCEFQGEAVDGRRDRHDDSLFSAGENCGVFPIDARQFGRSPLAVFAISPDSRRGRA